ncbi:MAG: glycoside hydrolase family 3 N-terminal domain-containing protein [Solirubrobacterales bacterium]
MRSGTPSRRRAVRRRRAVALGLVAGLAAGAFALGVALGKGSDGAAAPPPPVASTLPARLLAGERLIAGVPGTRVPPRLRAAIRRGELAGVVLFAESFPSRAAGRRLIAELQRIPRPAKLREPLLVMVDQEGGQVKRLAGAPTASAREMGERGPAFSRRQGRRTAANLRQVGVNVDLAPVLDVARPDGVIAATERGFGSSAAAVAANAVPFAAGLEAGGVAATGKHFPGFGAARENTDFASQRIGLSKARLRAVDEVPFRRFIAAGGELVMLSTAIYPAFSGKPAAFARPLATGELRGRLGFEGVSLTDALQTAAVADFGGPRKAALAAVRAGTDLLLFTDLSTAAAVRRALAARLRSGSLNRAEFEAAAQRVLDLRASLGGRT